MTPSKTHTHFINDKEFSNLTIPQLKALIPQLKSDEERYFAQLEILLINSCCHLSLAEKTLNEIFSNVSIKSNSYLYHSAELVKSYLHYAKFEHKKEKQLIDKIVKSVKDDIGSRLWFRAYLRLAEFYGLNNEYENAEKTLGKISDSKIQDQDIDLQIKFENIQGEVQYEKGQFDLAYNHRLKAKELSEGHNFQNELAYLYYKMAILTRDPNKAEMLVKKSIDLSEKLEIPFQQFADYSLLATILIYSDRIAEAVKISKSAYEQSKNYESLFIKFQAHLGYLRALVNKFKTESGIAKSKSKLLVQLSRDLVEIAYDSKNQGNIIQALIRRGELLFFMKEYAMAIDEISKFKFSENEVSKISLKLYYDILYKNYKGLKDFENALKFYTKMVELNDKLTKERMTTHINDVEAKYKTKEKEAEVLRLQELEEIKARFFSQITHELRTPLTLIKGPLENIMKSEPSKIAIKNAKIIDRNTERLLLLVNQLLDINKLEAQKMLINNRVGYFDKFIKDLVSPFKNLATRNKIKFSTKLNFKNLSLNFDADKVEKIIYNLLSNAFKFTDDGGSVELIVDKTKSKDPGFCNLIIKVKDSGSGISEEQLPKIFDRFYQADNSSTRTAEGTGIGLALVKEITELLNGKINVESKIRKGTIFTVELSFEAGSHLEVENIDLNIPSVKSLVSPQNSEDFGTVGLNRRVPLLLVIEDNEDMHTYIESVFEKHYRIRKAKNGEEGIEKALKFVPDIIISDVMMPIKNGYEVCNELKKDNRTSHIPIILLTAKAALKSRIEGFEQGADAYISKPFSAEELRLQSKNLLQTVRQARERYNGFIKESDSEHFDENKETLFLKSVISIIEDNIDDQNLSSEKLADLVFLSRSQLYRKIQALTGCSISEFIRTTRLAKGKQLLESKKGNISQISYSVGLRPSYFSKTFKDLYGISPKKLLEA